MTENNQNQVQSRRAKKEQLGMSNGGQTVWRVMVFAKWFFGLLAPVYALTIFYQLVVWGNILPAGMFGLYAIPFCGWPIVCFIVASIWASVAYVIPTYQRWIVLRLGDPVKPSKMHPNAPTIGPGRVQLVPWIDKVVDTADIREDVLVIKYNDMFVKSGFGAGYIYVNPEVKVFFRIVAKEAHLSFLEVKNITSQLKGLTEGSVRDRLRDYTVDELQSASEVIIKSITARVNDYSCDWGIDVVRIEITDWGFPRELVKAWTLNEQAETEAQAAKTQAGAILEVMRFHCQAARESLGKDASQKDVADLAYRTFQTTTFGQFSKGGALPVMPLDFQQQVRKIEGDQS